MTKLVQSLGWLSTLDIRLSRYSSGDYEGLFFDTMSHHPDLPVDLETRVTRASIQLNGAFCCPSSSSNLLRVMSLGAEGFSAVGWEGMTLSVAEGSSCLTFN